MTTILDPRALLERLVAFPTVSSESNLELVDWVEEYLAGFGIACHRDLTEDGRKASLFAHAGPREDGGIVLSGHSDVVPVEGQEWTFDPWTVTERDGKLYGRGTCDMKGFDALAIWALVEASRRGVARPLQLALSRDEEIGCVGAPPMIRAMRDTVPMASAAIIGEPSMMKAVTGHKGGAGFHVHVEGVEVHSSIMHTGVNAIMESAEIIAWANRVNEVNRAAEPTGTAAVFDPSWTTVHVGQIKGGTAHNITAGDCWFGVDFRTVPGQTTDEWGGRLRAELDRVEAGMKAVDPRAAVHVEPYFALPGLKPEDGGEAEELVRRITGDNSTNVVSYGTDAGHFQEAGYSAVICGPGDIARAHQADEYLEISQLEAGRRFMEDLLRELGAGDG